MAAPPDTSEPLTHRTQSLVRCHSRTATFWISRSGGSTPFLRTSCSGSWSFAVTAARTHIRSARKRRGRRSSPATRPCRKLVEAFRFPGPGRRRGRGSRSRSGRPGRMAEARREALPGFRGVSVGEYRAAMRTCVRYECMDYCRPGCRRTCARAGSLDEQIPSDEGEGRGKFDDAMFRRELERLSEADAIERECERVAALDAAIAMLDSEDKRRVLEMTRDGRSADEIAGSSEPARQRLPAAKARHDSDEGTTR